MELLIEMITPYHINQFSSTFIIQTLKNVILKIMIINGAKLFDKNLNFCIKCHKDIKINKI